MKKEMIVSTYRAHTLSHSVLRDVAALGLVLAWFILAVPFHNPPSVMAPLFVLMLLGAISLYGILKQPDISIPFHLCMVVMLMVCFYFFQNNYRYTLGAILVFCMTGFYTGMHALKRPRMRIIPFISHRDLTVIVNLRADLKLLIDTQRRLPAGKRARNYDRRLEKALYVDNTGLSVLVTEVIGFLDTQAGTFDRIKAYSNRGR